GDELGAKRAGEQHQKDAQRPSPASVAAEVVEPPAVHWREFQPRAASIVDAPRRLRAAEGRKLLGTSGGAAFICEREKGFACALAKGVEGGRSIERPCRRRLGQALFFPLVHPHTSRVSKSMRGSIQVYVRSEIRFTTRPIRAKI